MATCPRCYVSSHQDPDSFTEEPALVARPIGSFSLAGAQMKFSAVEALRMSHTTCGWSVLGRDDGQGYLVVDRELNPDLSPAEGGPIAPGVTG